MKANPWAQYPIISALVLGAATATLLVCGYFYLDGVPDSARRMQALHLRSLGAAAAWVLGCGLAARTRDGTWRIGFLCSLLFLPGLLILLWLTGQKDRHEVWLKANPQLVDKPIRRHYRNVKALY